MRRFLPIILVIVALGVLARMIMLAVGSGGDEKRPRLVVHFVDVGPGGCTVIRTPDGRTILIDAGSSERSDHLLSYLSDLEISRIDLLVITSSDEVRAGGLPMLLEEVGVSRVLDAARRPGGSAYQQAIRVMDERRIDRDALDEGRDLGISNCVQFKVLWPAVGARVSGDESVVLRLAYGEISFLLAGDMAARSEARLLAEYHDLRSTVLRVPNSGDPLSASNEFLQIVRPEYAVVFTEAGAFAETVMDRLIASGSKVFRTDENGDIVFSTDGLRVWTECAQ